jgi:hypothetical protein
LFKDIKVGDRFSKEQIKNQIVKELSVHAVIEEQLVYPAFRNLNFEDNAWKNKLADKSLLDHQLVKNILKELDTMDTEHPKFSPLIEQVIKGMSHLVRVSIDICLQKRTSTLKWRRGTCSRKWKPNFHQRHSRTWGISLRE